MKRKLAIAAMVISLFILLVVTVWVIFYLPKAWFLPLMFDAVMDEILKLIGRAHV